MNYSYADEPELETHLSKLPSSMFFITVAAERTKLETTGIIRPYQSIFPSFSRSRNSRPQKKNIGAMQGKKASRFEALVFKDKM